jgi:HlyD family secretion protein
MISRTPVAVCAIFTGLVCLCTCGKNPQKVQAVSAAVEQKPKDVLPPGAVRITGLVRAVRVFSIQTPQIAMVSASPMGNRLTLVTMAPNGAKVKEGDTLAEFDNTRLLDDILEVEAKYDDLGHQVKQKAAQNQSEAEKRISDMKQAEADLSKAMIQLKKGPVLSDVERKKNEIKAESATNRVKSLKKSHEARVKAEAAALRILELQQERQKVALERAKASERKLTVKAPLGGMIALENIWKGGTMGHPREGDQLWPGQPLLKIFDPTEMVVDAQLGEPDGTRMKQGMKARVQLDAYPGLTFDAVFESASPVATTALGSPVRNFRARFRLLATDPRLLPDLSAAVVVTP